MGPQQTFSPGSHDSLWVVQAGLRGNELTDLVFKCPNGPDYSRSKFIRK